MAPKSIKKQNPKEKEASLEKVPLSKKKKTEEELDEEDGDLFFNEDAAAPGKKASAKKATSKKKKEKEDDDFDNDIADDWNAVDDEDDWDPDFNEFDIPKSKSSGPKKTSTGV